MKIAFTDYRISKEEEMNLEKLNCTLIKCGPCERVYEAINGHPDILIHKISENKILVHRDMPKDFKNKLEGLGITPIDTEASLEDTYPKDVILNAITTSTHFIHNLNSTDSVLLGSVGKRLKLNVKQGYTKCSTAVLSDEAFITSDKSIYTALINQGLDVLLLPPGDILLPGLNYGFIGGTCGMIDENTIAFFGNLEFYKYKEEVISFLQKHNIKPVYLYNGPLIDRGSLIIVNI